MSSEFLGRGWKFPVQVDPATGRIRMSEYEEDIAESIRIILGTSKGERVMRPGFGCDMREFVFGTTDDTTLRMLEGSIVEAIRIWEPRVEEVEVNAIPDRTDPGKVQIRIQYLVRTTNNLFNQVYPFYLYEGTN
ncbi:GPW/gp25 family protein [Paenibacillus hemerocallicola]|jgi:phage baseplate assembly protein W|uniref:GPW/gp25 family protein n=1 Tax=Paenibacillus hemerocallicola TaxID=1172614 RepID=A0A5C4T0Q4_9BACL|nr:GPW/gp25 family protein [Paenibacillus hemerocallicola]TNJ62385.1 GPW/gp25 family protein [Paenibacillus hemerocallicola]